MVSGAVLACTRQHKPAHNHGKPVNELEETTNTRPIHSWQYEVVSKYMLDSAVELLVPLDSTVTYIQDNQIREGITYHVFQVAHWFEHKLITDKWYFIDSAKGRIYDYDLVNDSLILVKP